MQFDFLALICIVPALFFIARRVMVPDETGTCSICTFNLRYTKEERNEDDFEDDGPIKQLPCLHKFHENCIRTWFDTKDACPYCRCGGLSSDSIRDVGVYSEDPELHSSQATLRRKNELDAKGYAEFKKLRDMWVSLGLSEFQARESPVPYVDEPSSFDPIEPSDRKFQDLYRQMKTDSDKTHLWRYQTIDFFYTVCGAAKDQADLDMQLSNLCSSNTRKIGFMETYLQKVVPWHIRLAKERGVPARPDRREPARPDRRRRRRRRRRRPQELQDQQPVQRPRPAAPRPNPEEVGLHGCCGISLRPRRAPRPRRD